MRIATAQTVLDAPVLPLFDEDEIRWQRIRAEHDRLMSLPAVAAVLDTAVGLTCQQRDRLSALWMANFGVHRLGQTAVHHRLSRADPDKAMRLRAVENEVWSRAGGTDGLGWPGAHAVADAAFAAACGALLTEDEARLFTKPWTDVVAA